MAGGPPEGGRGRGRVVAGVAPLAPASAAATTRRFIDSLSGSALPLVTTVVGPVFSSSCVGGQRRWGSGGGGRTLAKTNGSNQQLLVLVTPGRQ